MLIKLRKAQVTAEYAILFALVVAAALGIQNYVRRAIQGRIYDAANDFVTSTGGNTLQYEPESGHKVTTEHHTEKTMEEDHGVFSYSEDTSFDFESEITK